MGLAVDGLDNIILLFVCSQERSTGDRADQSRLPLNSHDNQAPRLLRLNAPSAQQTPSLIHEQNERGAAHPVR